MKDRNMLFVAIPSICASSPKKMSIYNEEMIVARSFIGFLIFTRKSLGKITPEDSNDEQRLLRMSLRICSILVESLPTACCVPKCEKILQAFIVTGFHFSVSERFVSGSTFKASTIDLLREGFIVLRKVRVGALFRKNKKNLIHVFMLTEERIQYTYDFLSVNSKCK
ncbi:hypothetical protein ZWY2020_054638 [Hordeum vulgare]|nr:hypothetical protein ZWY2020_054638 [Hordeum vulgare]